MDRKLILSILLLLPSITWGHTHTSLLGLCKPDEDEYDWLSCVNGNWDILDSSGAQTNASAMTTGTLPNARLDPSSVTMLGPNPAANFIGAGALPSTVYVSSYQVNTIPGQAIKQSTIPITALNQSGCSTDQTILWNGSRWTCHTPTDVSTIYPSWTKYTLSYTDFAKSATSSTTYITSLSAKTVLHSVKIKHSQAFTGGSISKYTVEVGTTTTTDLYTSPFNVNATVAADLFQLSLCNHSQSYTTAWNVLATAKSTGDNLDVAIQGSVDIWLLTSILP